MDNNLVLHYNSVLHNLHPNDYTLRKRPLVNHNGPELFRINKMGTLQLPTALQVAVAEQRIGRDKILSH